MPHLYFLFVCTSRMPLALVDSARAECDLVVIEGMGRALHTNLLASFTCDTLKLAVIKNRWLANRLVPTSVRNNPLFCY